MQNPILAKTPAGGLKGAGSLAAKSSLAPKMHRQKPPKRRRRRTSLAMVGETCGDRWLGSVHKGRSQKDGLDRRERHLGWTVPLRLFLLFRSLDRCTDGLNGVGTVHPMPGFLHWDKMLTAHSRLAPFGSGGGRAKLEEEHSHSKSTTPELATAA